MDIYPDLRRERMTIWLRTSKHCYKVTDDYDPVFYLQGAAPEKCRKMGFQTRQVSKKVAPGGDKPVDVTEVSPGRLIDPKRYVSALDFFEGFGEREFFNVDLNLEHRYMVDKGISPVSPVEWNGGWKKAPGEEYPDLRILSLDPSPRGNMHAPLELLVLNGENITGDEGTILEELNCTLKRYDPDVVLTRGGDTFVLPYLYYRGELSGVNLELGREPSLHLLREGRSHESYGRVIYRPNPQMLKGRIHIDADSSFMYSQGGLEGLLAVSRLSKIPPQKMARYSPGRAVDHMEMEVAMKRGYIIPWKRNMAEDFKPLGQLLLADRGGITMVPEVGIHRGVSKVDFASMYPSLIVRYNISPDTMGCTCGDHNVVPELGYRICRQKKGLIPRTIEPILEMRRNHKAMSRGDDAHSRKADALKWLLVTCFGYTGYKKARFSKIEVHESITAYGRETLLKAAEIAQEMGYRVLHGIVDSLWLKGDPEHISQLLSRVNRATGIELEHEGDYSWVAFSPSRGNKTVGVPTRYFGVLDGKLEVKGLHLRRHDTPPFFREVQMDMFEHLMDGDLDEGRKGCLDVVREARVKLLRGNVTLEELTFTKNYSGRSGLSDVSAAHELYKEAGMPIRPGQKVRYVVKREGSRNPGERVSIPHDPWDTYDRRFYEKYLFMIAEEVTAPMGLWREDIRSLVERL